MKTPEQHLKLYARYDKSRNMYKVQTGLRQSVTLGGGRREVAEDKLSFSHQYEKFFS